MGVGMDDVVATFSLCHSAIWFEDVIMFVLWRHSHVPNIPRLNTRIILNYGHSVGCYSVQTAVISNALPSILHLLYASLL